MSQQPDVRFTVLGGYLGAGKTTLLNEMLADPAGERLGVIVNDIGEINVDAQLIESATDDLIALGNGCVCCSAADGFGQALETLRGHGVDHVVVEVSGVGDPWRVAQWGRTPGFALAGVLVLADATAIEMQAMDGYVGETVAAQLRGGDLVVLTKSDAATDGGESARTWLETVTDAPVVVAPRGARSVAALLGALEVGTGSGGIEAHHDHRVWSVPTVPALERARWLAWLAAAPTAVVRVKGVVPAGEPGSALVVQRVGRRTEVYRHRGDVGPSGLVVVASAAADERQVAEWLSTLDTFRHRPP